MGSFSWSILLTFHVAVLKEKEPGNVVQLPQAGDKRPLVIK